MPLLGAATLLYHGCRFVINEAQHDARVAADMESQEVGDLEDLREELFENKGAYIAVIDEMQNVALQGRIHRIRKHAIVLDTRLAENAPDGSLTFPPGSPTMRERKVWVPKKGQHFILLDDGEDDEED